MLVADSTQRIRHEVGKVIAGQSEAVGLCLVALIAKGHVLLEGVPGVAKTLLVRTLAQTLDLKYGRVQFTPDLMPSDLVGVNIYNAKTSDFVMRRGPIFAQVLLADEINRTPPKTQAALLEAMEEGRATIDGEGLELPSPFHVFATQNPVDFEGTYPLPEAQQDRFLMKIVVDYPSAEEEVEVLRRHHMGFRPQQLRESGVEPVLGGDDFKLLVAEADAVRVEEEILRYIQQLLTATRESADVTLGASPRAGISLLRCAKAWAAMQGRDYVIPDDVKGLALPVLRHRILLRPEAEVEGVSVAEVLEGLLGRQAVPR